MTNATKSFLSRAAKALTPKQEQLDINDNGKIDKEDLANLRKGAKPDPVGGSAAVTAAAPAFKFFADKNGSKFTKNSDEAQIFNIADAVKAINKIEDAAIIPNSSTDFFVVVIPNIQEAVGNSWKTGSKKKALK